MAGIDEIMVERKCWRELASSYAREPEVVRRTGCKAGGPIWRSPLPLPEKCQAIQGYGRPVFFLFWKPRKSKSLVATFGRSNRCRLPHMLSGAPRLWFCGWVLARSKGLPSSLDKIC